MAAEVENLLPEDRIQYETNVINYYDYQLTLKQEFKDGKAEGRAEGATQKAMAIAKDLLANGVSIEIVIKSTGLTKDQIADL